MVAPAALTFDTVAVAISLLLPGLAWAVLFVLAWRHPRFARSVGLGRREFWLLFPGAIAATFAVVPLAPVAHDVLAVSLSGAIFPLLVGTLAMRRFAPPLGRSARALFLGLGIEGAVALLPVLPASSEWIAPLGRALRLPPDAVANLLVVAVALVVGVLLSVVLRARRDPQARRISALYFLTSAVVVLTFLGSSAIAGVGIVEEFPEFLLPPLGVGIVAGLVAEAVFRGEEGFALPAAFFAGAWGTTLGADLLRQPGLYGGGEAGIYVIGGAGVLDLVYLSGFLALAGAYLMHVIYRRPWEPLGTTLEEEPERPTRKLREAFDRGLHGDVPGSLRASADAARLAAGQARRLRTPGAAPELRHPWAGLPVPGWVVSDHQNLESIARSGSTDSAEGLRGWLTARWLVAVAGKLSRHRFATGFERSVAFGVDLAMVGGGSAAVLTAIALASTGSLDDLLASVGFNAALYGCITAAFLYLVLAELFRGTTLGKHLAGIEVRDRGYRRVGGIASLLRNLSLLPTLTLVCFGIALAVASVVKGQGSDVLAGVAVPGLLLALAFLGVFVGVGLALLGGLGLIAIQLTYEHQRLGDLWAGTWVVRTLRPSEGPGELSAGSPTPSAADRSG